MKIGILTYHAAHNYGAVLQTYGLSSYLKKETDANIKIVDFQTREGIKAYSILKKPENIKQLIFSLIKLLFYRRLKIKYSRFNEFIESLDLTKRIDNIKELTDLSYELDIIISGSDQVFSPNGRSLPEYYLSFCSSKDVKKVAYAPSFGFKSIPEEKKNQISDYLKGFSLLSAREKSGVKIIQDLTGIIPEHVLDPVFLLTKEEWTLIESPVTNIPEKFILCYALVGKKSQMSIAESLKKITGLPIVLITSHFYPPSCEDISKYDTGPREFIWLFSRASYIVTDSFHGTSFSIVFNKPFFTFIAYPEKSERILSLLESLQLSDRVITESYEIRSDSLVLNYGLCNQILLKKTGESKAYLKKAISL